MKLMHRLRSFAAAKKGMGAIEFALIAPMMIALLFGSVDLLNILNASKRAQMVTSSLSDVIARDTEVTNAEMNGLWNALDVLMFPNDATGLQVRITSVSITSSTNARVVWSDAHGGMTPLAANAPVALDSRMMTPGSIIMTETSYSYSAPMNFLFEGPITMRHVSYRRSRLVDPIPRTT